MLENDLRCNGIMNISRELIYNKHKLNGIVGTFTNQRSFKVTKDFVCK